MLVELHLISRTSSPHAVWSPERHSPPRTLESWCGGRSHDERLFPLGRNETNREQRANYQGTPSVSDVVVQTQTQNVVVSFVGSPWTSLERQGVPK